jgi:hypothetical protein
VNFHKSTERTNIILILIVNEKRFLHFNIENVLWEARLFQGRVRVTEPSSENDVRDACTMLAYNYVLSEVHDVTVT